jgi:hypothetical protein
MKLLLINSTWQVLRIFSHLPKRSLCAMSAVSKKFNRLSKDESLWTAVDALAKVLTPTSLNSILNHNPTFLRLARSTVSSRFYFCSHGNHFSSLNCLPTKMFFLFIDVCDERKFSLVSMTTENNHSNHFHL